MNDIDIVIPWVDGTDPQWRAAFDAARATSDAARETFYAARPAPTAPAARESFEQAREYFEQTRTTETTHNPDTAPPVVATGAGENASEIRYRDWGTLRYLLRGIERFAPWVRRVHLVTCGHLPPWLEVRNPRLNVVIHSDFIPAEYLPTFASRPIELNVHRIEGLAQKFILFNDDMLLLRPVPESRFFRRGLPCDMARLSLIAPSSISHTVLNMVEIIARRHSRRESMRRHAGKWFSPRYGLVNILKTCDLALWRGWSGLLDSHMPQPYLRSTFEQLWAPEPTGERAGEPAPTGERAVKPAPTGKRTVKPAPTGERAILDATCRQRFRSPMGVNHWLMRYEQLATGLFAPVSHSDTRLDELTEERINLIDSYIRAQKGAMICLNDSPRLRDFEATRDRLLAALDAILPDKSRYEL